MKNTDFNRRLIFGIGNEGREDDGLGWAFLERLEEAGIPDRMEYRYQLQVEDAELISGFRQVIFVDADIRSMEKGHDITRIWGEPLRSVSSHKLSPQEVLYLCKELYQREPIAYLIRIQGHRWSLRKGLSERAKRNLEASLASFLSKTFQMPHTELYHMNGKPGNAK